MIDRGVGRAVPARQRPCTIHRTHKPTPVASELHHRFPKYLQVQVWGEVRENDTEALCGTGHSDVHFALDALLAGRKMPPGVGKTEREMANYAFTRFTDAKNAR